ncbi:MAG: pyruvate formate lyase family protein [Planctomycetota bacterium]|jgi:formate C-acetyltransferase
MALSPRLEKIRAAVRSGEYKKYRRTNSPDVLSESQTGNYSWMKRMACLTRRMCQAQEPVILPDEKILFTRTTPEIPLLYPADKWNEMLTEGIFHELGPISNICADWQMILSQGLLKRKETALQSRKKFVEDKEAVEFLDCAIETIDAVLELAAKYAQAAHEEGLEKIAEILENVPANPPRNFHEALQFFRLVHSVVWLSSHYHVGLGRFDQYMWPYLKADLGTGKLNIEEAQELLAEFFISLNKDSDLYPGVQQGDNGQSLMLGGLRPDGSDGVNELTKMVLRVACDTQMIDPKINLRINSDTDLDLLYLATKLTAKGLGFPQYSNDDVVIPALVKHGYDIEDARNYTVAACWEFIIPGKGMEIVNVDAVSMPAAADKGIRQGLKANEDFETILTRVQSDIDKQVKEIMQVKSKLILPPAPYYSVLMDGCLENGRDLSKGLKYNNYGIHGACSADAADALGAVRKFVFDEKTVKAEELLDALNENYKGYEKLRNKLANEAPKAGNNDDYADSILLRLFDFLCNSCEAIKDNGRGGIVRPGAGSAMYYVWLAVGEKAVGPTAEGRFKGEFFSANLSPSPKASVRGPISTMQSFSKIDYQRLCNGGPVTMELSDSVFCNEDSIKKVAMLVKSFAQMSGQQLQLNTLNVDTLRDAKKNPEVHKNLIVRVWGWSGYFCELGQEYQDHIIARHEYKL